MRYPLIREIQLGKNPREFVAEHFVDYNFQGPKVYNKLPEIVSELVRINKPDVRFVVFVGSGCEIRILNAKSPIELDYWDYEYQAANDDDARMDCEILNEIVARLFGQKRKRARPKITNKEFLKKSGRICPFCLSTSWEILDCTTYVAHDEMGCRECGETWRRKKKTVYTGFSR